MGEAAGDGGGFTGFGRIGLVGLGLIGGSLALAIRERWPGTVLVAVDRPEVLADAVARGVITQGAPRAAALAGEDLRLDLIVLAAPVLQNAQALRDLLAAARRPLLVTDVGSTKLSIVRAYRAHRNPHLTFVGGHPIAGTAQAGLLHARADLFRARPWLFTPDPDGAADAAAHLAALQQLQRFVRALGAEPGLVESADEHDRIMAYVSHLPQLAASALMRVAGESVGPPGFAHSGAGLFDTTRLASSPATMWTEILKSNADHVRLALDAFIKDLQAIRDQLTAPGAADWLETGARWRARLVNTQTEEVAR